jgi:integrase
MKSKFIDSPELRELKEHIDAEAWLPLWVSLETGLRIGDVVKLKGGNVREDGIHYKAKKTNKNGVAKISAELRRALPKSKTKWLFPSPYKHGAHITRQCVWSRIKRAAKNAGVDADGISPHSMRKVFAVELYREKGFKAVQDALQHSNSATTEIYSFADWETGKGGEAPLLKRDLPLIVRMCLEALGKQSADKRSKKEQKNSGGKRP